MRWTAFLSVLIPAGFVSFLALVNAGCANIIPPTGGPRDSLPPRLLSVSPPDSTRNFRGTRIVFNFDEYIADPQDLSNNLLFTPTFEVNPEIAIRAKTVTLRFRDSLRANTTYTLNFGSAIRDVNEGNALRNFAYVFSTGPTLDSLSLSGKVVMAETGGTDSTLIVMLHRNLADSAVQRQRPVYVARVNAAGEFRFQNLPREPFALYALGEGGLLRQYNDPSRQAFAFADSLVVPGQTTGPTLYAYKIPKPPLPAAPSRTAPAAPAERRLRFAQSPAAGAQLDLQGEFTLTFPSPLRSFDSARALLTADTGFAPVAYRVSLDSSRTVLRFRSDWREGGRYNLVLEKEFAEDSAGRRLLKADTVEFAVKKRSDYARLNVRLRNLDASRNPVLLFLQNDAVVFSAPVRGGSYRSVLFAPGDYDLRILYDANGNGRWDPGDFFKGRRQPERVQPLSRKIAVKAGQDADFDLAL